MNFDSVQCCATQWRISRTRPNTIVPFINEAGAPKYLMHRWQAPTSQLPPKLYQKIPGLNYTKSIEIQYLKWINKSIEIHRICNLNSRIYIYNYKILQSEKILHMIWYDIDQCGVCIWLYRTNLTHTRTCT